MKLEVTLQDEYGLTHYFPGDPMVDGPFLYFNVPQDFRMNPMILSQRDQVANDQMETNYQDHVEKVQVGKEHSDQMDDEANSVEDVDAMDETEDGVADLSTEEDEATEVDEAYEGDQDTKYQATTENQATTEDQATKSAKEKEAIEAKVAEQKKAIESDPLHRPWQQLYAEDRQLGKVCRNPKCDYFAEYLPDDVCHSGRTCVCGQVCLLVCGVCSKLILYTQFSTHFQLHKKFCPDYLFLYDPELLEQHRPIFEKRAALKRKCYQFGHLDKKYRLLPRRK